MSVGGMSCAACVRRVERILKEVPGVVDAQVNLAASKATLVHPVGAIAVPDVKKALDDAGYEFLGVVSEAVGDLIEEARQAELHDLKVKLVVGFTLSVTDPRRIHAPFVSVYAPLASGLAPAPHVCLDLGSGVLGGEPVHRGRVSRRHGSVPRI